MTVNHSKNPNCNLVQSNDLINASYKLTRNEMRLLVLSLTKVNSKLANPGNISLYPKEFIEMFKTNEEKVWVTMRDALISLSKKQVEFFRSDKNDLKTINFINWIDGGSFYKNQEDCSKIVLKFTQSIEPYLFELKGNFTICTIEAIQKLTNPIALRLYWIMLSEIKKAKSIAKKKSKKLDSHILTIPINHIKKMFPNLSKEFNNIKKFTLIPAFEQIQTLTNISLHWKTIKTGRSVSDIEITYILEHNNSSPKKPTRPRLKKRPHVIKNSHNEGEWMKKNSEILYQYEQKLKEYDPNLRFNMPDLRRAVEYSKYCNHKWHKEKKAELEMRRNKTKKNSTEKTHVLFNMKVKNSFVKNTDNFNKIKMT